MTRHTPEIDQHAGPGNRLPKWLKVPLPGLGKYGKVSSLLERKGLHTVCQSARCPNIGECFGCGVATFLVLGTVCSRNCRFCNISSGKPAAVDAEEPHRIAEAVRLLDLKHVVITSVTRDDLADGGAGHFAATIRAIRHDCSGVTIEVLIPDFQGSRAALQLVLEAAPEILNHNVETVPRLYRQVRPEASYERSLEVLRNSFRINPAIPVKSGFMIGLGETYQEILTLLSDLHRHHCAIVTIGQYLAPSSGHLPVRKYYHPDEFRELEQKARETGFTEVYAAPRVRSSYHAHNVQLEQTI